MDKKQIQAELASLMTLEALARAYAEISSRRMKEIRGSVLTTRDFLAEIDSIFSAVRESYKKEVLALARKKGKKDIVTFLPHNGKTVAVFLSANAGLYGDIVARTFRAFMDEVKVGKAEATIIGKLGLSQFLTESPNASYTYFDFPDYGVNKDNLGEIVRHLAPYEEIHIYHGKFQNLVRQEPNLFNISAETPLSTAGAYGAKLEKYIFEPSLEKILIYFESEMFTSLLEQVTRESQLAKFASRMLAMDTASENIRKKIGSQKISMLRATHAQSNRKLLSTFTSFSLWRRP